MARHNTRHLDQRRLLLPRDYAANASQFGADARLGFHVPPGGDEPSMRVAREQHLLFCAWNRHRRPTAAALARMFGTSKQTISRTSCGHRWAGGTLLAAVFYANRIAALSEQERRSRNRK